MPWGRRVLFVIVVVVVVAVVGTVTVLGRRTVTVSEAIGRARSEPVIASGCALRKL